GDARAGGEVGVVVIAAAGEVIEQRGERLAGAAAADDLDGVGGDDVAAAGLEVAADAAAIGRRVRIVLPLAGVGVELVVGVGDVRRVVGGVIGGDAEDLEDGV